MGNKMINRELLNNVIADPDNDGPRLEYADWCEQAAEKSLVTLAAYIRASVALANLAKDDKSVKQFDLTQRANFYEQRCTDYWRPHFPDYVLEIQLVRGFPECVKVSAEDFLKFADQLYTVAPIRHLDIINLAPVAQALFDSPHLTRIRSLNFERCELEDEHIFQLSQSDHLSCLRWLSVKDNKISQDGVEYLARSDKFASVVYIDFIGNPFEPNEQYSYDNGFVVDSGLPEEGLLIEQKYGHIAWLHHDAKAITDATPDRFTAV
jgi:uncharacterized protein (TIGR02996 family)